MTRTVTIGEHEVRMTANGATPYRYKNLFRGDVLKLMMEQSEGMDTAVTLDVSSKLAYIMAMQAAGAKMDQLTMEDFMGWLEQFDPMDLTEATDAIYDLYLAQSVQASRAKKNLLELSGK